LKKKIRVYRCHWTDDGKIQKVVVYVTDKQYEFLDKKPVSSNHSNQWFEDYPIKWYEFYFLRRFLTNVINWLKLRYFNPNGIKRFIRDLIIAIIASLVVAIIL
jgi:hypothetical protein